MSGNLITLYNTRFGSKIRPNLSIINNELAKRGHATLHKLYGDNNCAVCSGTNVVSEWCVAIPCGHIICSDCVTTIHTNRHSAGIPDVANGICLVCYGSGTTFDIVTSNSSSSDSSLLTPALDSSCVTGASTGSKLFGKVIDFAKKAVLPTASSCHSVTPIHHSVPAQPVDSFKPSVPPFEIPASSTHDVSSVTNLTFGINRESNQGIAKLANIMTGVSVVPIDVVFLMDVSGSMSPYFTNLCTMVKQFIEQLSSIDRFTVINFSTRTSQPFPLMPVTDTNKSIMTSMVRSDDVWNGGTNMMGGAIHALKVIQEGHISGRSLHFVLVTDGQANYGQEGVAELKSILQVPGVITKLCTFGGNIDARHLMSVLGEHIENYVALTNMTDFDKMVKTISDARPTIQADNVMLSVNDTTLSVQQLRTNEEIFVPFKLLDAHELTNVHVTFIDGNGHTCTLVGVYDDALNASVNAIHTKKNIAESLLKMLNEVNELRDMFLKRNVASDVYMAKMEAYSKTLDDIYSVISKDTSEVAIYKAELMPIYKHMRDILQLTKDDPKKSALDSLKSNCTYYGLAQASRGYGYGSK